VSGAHQKLSAWLKMESSPMLKDWQNQYCENGYTTKSNLYVQNSNDFLYRCKKNPEVHMKAQ
jgi:hypothetical protein